MDLKVAGLCIILAIIVENVEARHLSGGRLPPIFGQRGFQFQRPFDFRGGIPGGIPGFSQAGILPSQFRRFGQARTPFRVPQFGSRFGSTRFPPMPALGINDRSLIRRQIGGLRRLSLGLNPTLDPTLRQISPQFSRTRGRIPFPYYPQQSRPGLIPRGRPITHDAIRQLRQRFRTRGTGTRDDPIRIIAPLSSPSGTLAGGGLSRLGSGSGLGLGNGLGPGSGRPLQRPSRPQRRQVQVSRARQQLQQRPQEEVIALFGFDQPAGGLPVLSETIDKQTKIKRTPIKKSPSTGSKITKSPSDLKRTEGLKSVNISKPITDEFLQKLNVHQLERLAKGVAEATKIQPLHEVKHVAQITEKRLVRSQTLETSLPVDIGAISTTPKKESTQHTVDTVIADADTVNININSTNETSGNENNKHVNDNVVKAADTSSQVLVGVPVAVNLHESTVDVAKTLIPEPVAIHADKGHIEPFIETVAKDPAGISVIADTTPAEMYAVVDTHLIDSTVSADTALPSETVEQIAQTVESVVLVPVDSVPVSDVAGPTESVSVTEAVAQAESVPAFDVVPAESVSVTELVVPGEGVPASDAVPIESVSVSEVVVPIESVQVSDIVVPVETVSVAEEMVPSESVPISDVIVPVESVSVTEVVAPGESVPVSDIIVPVESVSVTEVVVPGESVPVSDIIVPVETISVTEVVTPSESSPVSDILVPVEPVPVKEVMVSSESVPVSDVIDPVESVSVTEVVTPGESIPVSDVIPVETISVTEVVVPGESVPVSEIVVPTESVSVTDVVSPAESLIVSKTTVPVEISTAPDSVVSSETLVSKESVKTATLKEVSIPVSSISIDGKISSEASVPTELPLADNVAIKDTSLPIKHVPIVGHAVLIPEVKGQHVSVEKSVHHTETSQIAKKEQTLR